MGQSEGEIEKEEGKKTKREEGRGEGLRAQIKRGREIREEARKCVCVDSEREKHRQRAERREQ